MFKLVHSLKFIVALGAIVSVMACDPMAGRETAGEYVDDATITTKVIAAIVDDPELKKSSVSANLAMLAKEGIRAVWGADVTDACWSNGAIKRPKKTEPSMRRMAKKLKAGLRGKK